MTLREELLDLERTLLGERVAPEEEEREKARE
jgi:hypothetical protein